MTAKINKALDINKLFQEQAKGKLLKKLLNFPMYAPYKFDGNYVVILVERSKPTFITSGGLTYTHLDDGGAIFSQVPDAVYFAERIYGKGKLGDRNKCNLRGSKDTQTSIGHTYKVFGMIPLEDYYDGHTSYTYEHSADRLYNIFDALDYTHYLAKKGLLVRDQQELDDYLELVVRQGYEGVMCIDPKWRWVDTKSRKVTMCKYKKRPTVDLLVVGVNAGTGKYDGLIGSLKLMDKSGRIVDVGSGMSDEDRQLDPNFFIDKVVEMFYEQIFAGGTYSQPTFGSEYEGVLVRHDKTKEEID